MKILVTGGAGFIGSNLVDSLLQRDDVTLVRVLDNLSTGHYSNITEFENHSKFEFLEGDICNIVDCEKACEGIEAISHQAALGSVPRSINDPIASHNVNVNGFLNMLIAARKHNIERFVYASSSSVYGDLNESSKIEKRVGKVLSPYAATKMSNELYGEAFAKNYNMSVVGFRYFNVFGPKQDPNGPYAAVIPLFIKSTLEGVSPLINGDGSITRDFTPVENVVAINTLALFGYLEEGKHYVFNVACGQAIDLLGIWKIIKSITKSKVNAEHGPIRKGDILFSLADITFAKEILGYNPKTDLKAALENTINYYKGV